MMLLSSSIIFIFDSCSNVDEIDIFQAGLDVAGQRGERFVVQILFDRLAATVQHEVLLDGRRDGELPVGRHERVVQNVHLKSCRLGAGPRYGSVLFVI